jgi:hypothetical protein
MKKLLNLDRICIIMFSICGIICVSFGLSIMEEIRSNNHELTIIDSLLPGIIVSTSICIFIIFPLLFFKFMNGITQKIAIIEHNKYKLNIEDIFDASVHKLDSNNFIHSENVSIH